jgi:sodium/hydrogen antiporter
MPVFSPEQFATTLALIGVVIVISSLLSGLVERTGLPQVAVFLALGAIIGPFGLGVVDVTVDSPILRVVATLSLALVLFTDALTLNVTELRRHRLLGFLVLGPGTIAIALLIAGTANWMLGIPFVLAAMLGAGLASTDPVLLRGLLRRPELSTPVRQTLRIESGLNDVVLLPIIIVAMTAATTHAGTTGKDWAKLALNMGILSPAAGVIVALCAIGALDLVRRRVGVRRDYESVYSLGVCFGAFAAAESVHGSGFIAAFAAGMTISALDVELCDCFVEYGETTSEMALLFTFVLFGVSIIWSGLSVLTPWTLLFVAIIVLIRPLALFPSLAIARLPRSDRLMLGWFGPRGLSSLLLILLPVFAGIAGSDTILKYACLVVLCSVILHGFSPMFIFRKHEASAESAGAASTAKMVQGGPISNTSDGSESSSGMVAQVPRSMSDRQQAATSPASDGANAAAPSEFVTVEELQRLRSTGPVSVLLVDTRSTRSYDASDSQLADAVRISPDNAVTDARKLNLPKDRLLALFCA